MRVLKLFIIFLLPINVLAFSYENIYTLEMVNNIRNIIVGDINVDYKYDIYEDKKIDITDLVIHKILSNKPNVNIDVTLGEKGKKAYSSVAYNIK